MNIFPGQAALSLCIQASQDCGFHLPGQGSKSRDVSMRPPECPKVSLSTKKTIYSFVKASLGLSHTFCLKIGQNQLRSLQRREDEISLRDSSTNPPQTINTKPSSNPLLLGDRSLSSLRLTQPPTFNGLKKLQIWLF